MQGMLKDRIKERLLKSQDRLISQEIAEEELKEVVLRVLDDILRSERLSLSKEEKDKLIDEILNETVRFGPLEGLLKDPSVTEIMVIGHKKIYVERDGQKQRLSGISFENERQLMHIIQKMLLSTRRRVDESCPYADMSLKDGSRVNIIIPPLALDGPAITIRKFSKGINKIEDLIERRTLDKRMGNFLIACIKAKMNIVFSGATGSGKTTTLNILSSYIPEYERIVTIEDTAELQLVQDNLVRLETRASNIEGKGEVTVRELFRNSLRMRPDRIILGEIRGGEVLDMLQAICSGHRGSLAILHAHSPQDVVYRMETMILTSGISIALEAIRRQIAAALDLIVQQEQLIDGSRKITYITQVSGLKEGQVVLENLFNYEIEGISGEGKVRGRWVASGIKPVFYPTLKKMGVVLDEDIFTPV